MKNQTFNNLLNELKELHDRKNSDYSEGGNPYSNFEYSAQVSGISVPQSFFVLISTKMARIKSLTTDGRAPQNEALLDSYKDLANYCCILAAWAIDDLHKRFPLIVMSKDTINEGLMFKNFNEEQHKSTEEERCLICGSYKNRPQHVEKALPNFHFFKCVEESIDKEINLIPGLQRACATCGTIEKFHDRQDHEFAHNKTATQVSLEKEGQARAYNSICKLCGSPVNSVIHQDKSYPGFHGFIL